MNNEANKVNKCRVCDKTLFREESIAAGLCETCRESHQNQLTPATAINPLQSDHASHSDAAAVPPDANSVCQHNATVIPRETLDAMLKCKRQVKRKNMTRDEWIARAEKAEMELHEANLVIAQKDAEIAATKADLLDVCAGNDDASPLFLAGLALLIGALIGTLVTFFLCK